MRTFTFDGTFGDWKRAARLALADRLYPASVSWIQMDDAQRGLPFGPSTGTAPAPPDEAGRGETYRVPKRFVELARIVSLNRAAERWDLLYRLLWRLTHGEPQLLDNPLDADALTLARLHKEVTRAAHHMRAFVRFRAIATAHGPWFVAWMESPHHVLEMNAEFFVGRYATMNWSILTPDRCMHWDREELWYTPGVLKSTAPSFDATEDLWRTYYTSIFNPARVKVRTMVAHMPRKYWPDLPEVSALPQLLEEAPHASKR